MATNEGDDEATEPLDRDYPPLDVLDSRWWYWIAAYLGVSLFAVPVFVIAAVALFVPVFVVGPGEPMVSAPVRLLLLVFPLLIVAFLVVTTVVSAMLPVALYVDARHIARADLEWTPDPVLYGVLGLLQFVGTPLVGVLVAAYYLYRRHEHLGVP